MRRNIAWLRPAPAVFLVQLCGTEVFPVWFAMPTALTLTEGPVRRNPTGIADP
jgi:hypothetical protein